MMGLEAHDVERERELSQSVDRTIPFIETHHHVWELGRFPYRWLSGDCDDELLGDYSAICRDWLPASLYREFYGQNVSHCVHVEADSGAADPVDETIWLESVAAAHGRPDALVVMCDLGADGAERELVRHLEASSRVRGVRIREHPASPSAAFRSGYEALGRHDLSYELSASPGRLGSAQDQVRAYPDVQVILGHAGFPIRRDPDYLDLWRREMNAFAELDHVACKVSGFATIDHDWSVESIRPLVLACIDAFGVDRIMFGTDWPVGSLFASYAEQVDAYRRIVAEAGFSRAEQERMLHLNAERLYRL